MTVRWLGVMSDGPTDASRQDLRGSGSPFDDAGEAALGGAYTIDGRHRSESVRTRIEADRYRGRLLQAVQDGSRFHESSGEPDAWQTPLGELGVHEWARRWLTEQWAEWQPRTRTSAVEALARFTTIAIRAGAKPPDGLRVYLYTALAPGADTNLDVVLER